MIKVIKCTLSKRLQKPAKSLSLKINIKIYQGKWSFHLKNFSFSCDPSWKEHHKMQNESDKQSFWLSSFGPASKKLTVIFSSNWHFPHIYFLFYWSKKDTTAPRTVPWKCSFKIRNEITLQLWQKAESWKLTTGKMWQKVYIAMALRLLEDTQLLFMSSIFPSNLLLHCSLEPAQQK